MNSIFTSGFWFVIILIFLLILVSIQFTLNMILRELKEIRNRMGYNDYQGNTKVKR